MRTVVVLGNMDEKPEDCTACPLCNEDDNCQAFPWYETSDSWDEQYRNCPLRVLRIREDGDSQ